MSSCFISSYELQQQRYIENLYINAFAKMNSTTTTTTIIIILITIIIITIKT